MRSASLLTMMSAPGGLRGFQILVVLRIAAVLDRDHRFEPKRTSTDRAQDLIEPFVRQKPREFRPVKHLDDFRVHRGRQSKDICFFGMKQSPLRHAVCFESRADNG